MKFPFFSRTERRSIVGKGKKKTKGNADERAPLALVPSYSKVAEARKKIQLGAQANALRVFRRMKNQFADPNKCYRELVQNSMDAGTDRMYFEFNAYSVLVGEKMEEYLGLFAGELERKGKRVEELAKGLEELLISPAGECHELQAILGEGYAFAHDQIFASLSAHRAEKYISWLKEKINISVPAELHINTNQYGISSQILETLTDPLQKMKYVDFLVGWNAGGKAGQGMDGQNEIKTAMWEKLQGWRYRFLQELLAEAKKSAEQAEQNSEENQWLEENQRNEKKQRIEENQEVIHTLQHLANETKEEYAARMQRQWQQTHRWDHASSSEGHFFYELIPSGRSRLAQVLEGAPKRIEIIAEDFGKGMTHADRENFLKKIFATSKEGDRDQTGRFGVGFISVFALNPEEVIVESVKDGEAWEYHFLKETETQLPGKLYVFTGDAPRQRGTKVTITLEKRTEEQVRELINNAHWHLREDCKHVEKPIYIQGRQINQEFTLDAPLTVRFGKKGVEGIIGLVEQTKVSYRLENNRLRLEEKKQALVDRLFPGVYERRLGFSILVSSKYLNYDIARENVERDANFHYIVRLIRAQEDTLVREVFSRLEQELKEGRSLPPQENYLYYFFAQTYLAKKIEEAGQRKKKKVERLLEILPEGILGTTMLFTVEGENWSFRQLLEYLAGRKEQLIYTETEQNELTKLLARQGTQVFTAYLKPDSTVTSPSGAFYKGTTPRASGPWPNSARRALLSQIAECKEVQASYKTAKIQSHLSEEEQTFLDAFAQRLLASPLCRRFGKVVASHFEEGTGYGYEQSRPFKHIYESIGELAYYRVGETVEAQTHGSFFSRFWQKTRWYFSGAAVADTLAINIDHPYIRKIIHHEQIIADGAGYNLLLQAVCQESYGPSIALLQQLFKYEQQRVGKAEKYGGGMLP